MANFAQGGFSGGFARGAAASQGAEANRIRKQEITAAKQAQAQQRLEAAFKDSATAANDAFDTMIETMNEAAQNGATPEQLDQLSEAVMLGPNSHALFMAQLRAQARASGASDAEMELIPSPGEYIQTKRAQLDATRNVAEMIGNVNLGTQQFREGNDFVTRRTTRGVPDMTDAGVVARSPIDRIQRIEQGGPGAFSDDLRTDSQRGAAAQESIDTLEQAQQNILNLTEVGAAVSSSPRVAGVTGFLNEVVGGAVGQVSPAVASGLSEMLTGTDPQRASDLRANFRIIIAENLSNITGEESGRYTEPERQIAEQTIRAIPVNANAQQILGAFGTLLRVELGAESRELLRQSRPQRFSLLSESGQTVTVMNESVSVEALSSLDNFLIDAGIASPSIRDSIARYLIVTQAQGVVPLN